MLLYFMKTQELVLPVRCSRCGVSFDLWYDLLAREGALEEVAEALQDGEMRERLCWTCRKEAIERIGEMDEELTSNEGLTISWQ